jgi:glycoprotein 3-alpha-L-fucosyltransferase
VWENCAIGCHFRGSVVFEGEHKADAIFGLRNEPGIESVARSMESAQYYPDNDVANARA